MQKWFIFIPIASCFNSDFTATFDSGHCVEHPFIATSSAGTSPIHVYYIDHHHTAQERRHSPWGTTNSILIITAQRSRKIHRYTAISELIDQIQSKWVGREQRKAHLDQIRPDYKWLIGRLTSSQPTPEHISWMRKITISSHQSHKTDTTTICDDSERVSPRLS